MQLDQCEYCEACLDWDNRDLLEHMIIMHPYHVNQRVFETINYLQATEDVETKQWKEERGL